MATNREMVEIFRQPVGWMIEDYKEEGYTLDGAWAEFNSVRPAGISDELGAEMEKLFKEVWAEQS